MPATPTSTEQRLAALENELRQRERDIALLKETALAVGSELDLDTVLKLVAERARELIDAETVLIPTLSENCDVYTYSAGAGTHAEEIVGESLPLDFGVCGWVWKHRRAWWRGVLDELSPQERNQWEREVGTLILVPLVGRQHFLGGIAGMNKRTGGDFSERDLDLLTLFAGQVAIAIENAMAMKQLREAQQATEAYQVRLEQLNKRLVAVNQELEHLSLYDPLTQLPNRSLLRDRLHERMAAAGAGRPLAVLLVDLDRFQDVNDALGHEEGDCLIRTVAERFKAATDPAATLGRIGGDEFLVILTDTDAVRAMAVARALQESLRRPIDLSGQSVAVTASIGVALYPAHGADVTTLLKHADAAMYAAKRQKNDVQLYDEQLAEMSSGRLTLASDLQRALQEQAFQLVYQPKIALATQTIVGFEALARWPHRIRGFVPPEMFITAMEQTGLIHDFTCWAVDQAAQQCAAWRQHGWGVQVAVNVPVSVMLEPRFVDHLRKVLEHHPVGNGLVFEITESLFLSDYDRLSALLNRIRNLGIRFSIDDFGTGHSSLSRLRRLPVSELKIDRSFVMDMEKNRDDLTIVESTIQLAHNLGLLVVAEGVESAAALQYLARLNCDLVQGFHLGRPMPPGEIPAFVRKGPWRITPVEGEGHLAAG